MKSRRVQLIPRPQKMVNNLRRQGRSARLVERRSYCLPECEEAPRVGMGNIAAEFRGRAASRALRTECGLATPRSREKGLSPSTV